jgi:hypothetical protein
MNALIQALNAEITTTENGCKSYDSTLNKNLDLFYLAGSSRGEDITPAWAAAFSENSELATRIALYCRDIRQGQGERQQFKNYIKFLLAQHQTEILSRIITKIPELGRFDDLEVFFGTVLEKEAATVWLKALKDGNGLAFKWVPRKDKKGAKPLRKVVGMNEQQWRKFVVAGSSTVEQQMCAKQWDDINFEHVPSVASGRYQKAFTKQCGERYEQYKEALVKGEAKVNAGAVYPYDVLRALKQGDHRLADAQWKALPDFLDGSTESILPIVDVSGSMQTNITPTTTALDIAISLGLYLSERNKGAFKDCFMTFSEVPQLCKLVGTGGLSEKVQAMSRANWGMSTSIAAVFNLILTAAQQHNVPQEDMPSKLLIVSDMQFNQCMKNGDSIHAFTMMKDNFSMAGYKLPQIVFWQVNARAGGIPVTAGTHGTALVSGFSPSIMKSLLKGDLEPVKVMLDTVNVERYDF